MPTPFLVPSPDRTAHRDWDPYTVHGANNIFRRHREDIIEMLEAIADEPRDRLFLATSPLRRKPWIAGAMVTLGLIVEKPSPNGACAVAMTPNGVAVLERNAA